jgi:hypothetical protein
LLNNIVGCRGAVGTVGRIMSMTLLLAPPRLRRHCCAGA